MTAPASGARRGLPEGCGLPAGHVLERSALRAQDVCKVRALEDAAQEESWCVRWGEAQAQDQGSGPGIRTRDQRAGPGPREQDQGSESRTRAQLSCPGPNIQTTFSHQDQGSDNTTWAQR